VIEDAPSSIQDLLEERARTTFRLFKPATE
jgi:hypothetical protein